MLHIDLADQYHHGHSRLHQLDPRIKLLGAVMFILVATLLPMARWWAYGLLLGAAIFLARVSGLGLTYALKRALVAVPFALAAIALPVTVPGQPLAQWGNVTLSVEGTLRLVSILIKSWLSVQAAILLAVTTPFPDLLWGLRELRLPKPLISIVSFMYRYLFVMADEALRLMRARAARAGASPTGRSGGSLLWRGRVAGGLVGNLALRAFERSERIYDAMVARGFQGEIKTLARPTISLADRNLLVGWATYLGMTLMIGLVF